MRQSSAPPLAAPAVRQRAILVSAVVVAHAAVVAMILSAEVRVDQPPQPHVIRLQMAPFAGPQARQSSPPPMRPSLADAQQSRPQMKPAQSQPVQSQMQATPPTTPVTPAEPVGRAAAPSITNNTAVSEDRQPTIDASFRRKSASCLSGHCASTRRARDCYPPGFDYAGWPCVGCGTGSRQWFGSSGSLSN